jgi:membrane protease YdiL (CAAX protease family)
VVAFFVLAYGIAWGTWFFLSGLASDLGLETADFVGRIEAGDIEAGLTSYPFWSLYLLTRLIDFSFTISGLVVVFATFGLSGVRRLLGRLVRWRVIPKWYLLALLPVLFYSVAALVGASGEGGPFEFESSTTSKILFSLQAGFFVSLLLRGAMGEELGLRGFALARLQGRMSPFRASLVIGALWGLWHLPVLVGRDIVSVVFFLAIALAASFVLTWLFNGSGGSLIPPLLFHATQNWEEGFEAVFPSLVGTDWETIAAIAILVFGVVAAVAVRRRGAEQAVVDFVSASAGSTA